MIVTAIIHLKLKRKLKINRKYMIAKQLIEPKSIVVVGGSDDIHKPGGTVLRNLQDGNFKGSLYVVNPKMDEVQGIKAYRDVKDLPEVDCAILAIAAKFCPSTVEVLNRRTRKHLLFSLPDSMKRTRRGLSWSVRSWRRLIR